MAWVYILECAGGTYYVGSTRDLMRRLEQHASAQVGETARRRPVRLVWSQELDLDAAYRAERRIHGWSRDKKKALIDGDFERLKWLSKRKRVRDGDSSAR
ncbi:excinuclease ABC subunit C [Gordonia sp. GN26]